MWPPLQSTVYNHAPARALLGSNPFRFYLFGKIPETPGASELPYVAWQVINGSPENYLNRVPDMDEMTLQVDVYGQDQAQVTAASVAVRDAIEPKAHITFWRNMGQDPDTKLYRFTFVLDWHNPR